ncbi:MAG: hypothetical protein JSU00_15225 [Acidobacteria bacterium]|nr:hypothetical protein [Acidobacteriota bacterium]
MQTHFTRLGRTSRVILFAAALATAAAPLIAVETRYWIQDDFSDFEKGNLNKVSVRSDGRMFLAPVVTELLDSSTPYLWAVARDSKGNVYAGGGGPSGSTAKLFEIGKDGKSKTLAELDGLEIHAIAVDSHDRVYAATAPDGKVYRVVNGKAQVFYDPKAKYIWAMVFSKSGDLYVATGDRGEVHRVTPDGKGAVFFATEETHARSLAMDAAGNLIVGTEPNGLVVRVTPAGEGFVLYQTPKREITAVAAGADGSVYAAGVGSRPAVGQTIAPPAPAPVPVPSPMPSGAGAAVQTRQVAAAPSAASTTALSGGSEVYRIGVDGAPRKIWANTSDVVYALTMDAQGRPLVGSGNKGNVYRIDSDIAYTLLANLAPTQVTAFAVGASGEVIAATGNIGKVYRLGPGIEKTGAFESEPFDATGFSNWGRLSFEASLNGGQIAFESRSGNVNHPNKNWSPWIKAPVAGNGGRLASPPARFLQFRATITASADGKSPEVTGVDVAYMAKNVAPTLSQIEVTPANYRFTSSTSAAPPSGSPQSITLQPLGQRRKSSSAALEISSGLSMSYAKGHIGARWTASDENGDSLSYKVEIKGETESTWKPLKDKVHDKYVSWDSAAFPDGRYLLRVTATDALSNPPGSALTGEITSDPFLIDNTPPVISGLTSTPAANNKVEVRWAVKDALSVIDRTEYSINGGDWTLVEPVTHLSDAQELEYRLVVDRPQPGEITIAVRTADDYDNQTVVKTVM